MASAHWRLITTLGAPPSLNLGLDEALLNIGGAPTLRLYTWQPDTLSLGYFQRFADVHGTDTAGHVVRRITGGGAIHHAGELTFSLTTGLDDALYRGKVADSYARVHRAVIAALAAAGIQGELRGDSTLASDRTGTGMCFHHSTDLDIVWGGRKGVGSAQRRSGGRVLHHGSIKLGTTALEGDIATTGASGGPEQPEDFIPLLLAAFAEHLGLETEPTAPTQRERELASLLEPGYSDPAFLHRR
ncbi:MAG: hypothetical protein R3F33_03745 [Planctomycetota bacterium]